MPFVMLTGREVLAVSFSPEIWVRRTAAINGLMKIDAPRAAVQFGRDWVVLGRAKVCRLPPPLWLALSVVSFVPG